MMWYLIKGLFKISINCGETDISLTNQLADSQFADKTTRWH